MPSILSPRPVLPALRALACALAALALLLAAATPAAAERRVALLIGNGDYAGLPSLRNPANDASDLADALQGLGFEVSLGIDLDRNGMINAVGRFVRAAREADVSLFFYAGHGFQIDARNYLVPVDADLRRPGAAIEETIGLTEITGALAGSDGIHLFFLDACRENPLGALGTDATGAVRNGLAQVGDAAGFLFAFATQPDNVAYDGVGRNSFFTQALLSHIGTPGQDIASTMISVRRDVLAATGGRQVPWENSSLVRSFSFAPGEATASIETMLWQVAASAGDPTLMALYRDRFPEGAHVADVEAFLEAGDMAPQGEQARSLGDAPGASGAALWEIARRTRDRALVEAYLRQNPDGRHAAEARRLLATLPREEEIGATPALLCERLATHPRDATANAAGVPIAVLARQVDAAIEACTAAARDYPDRPHYRALLARAHHTAGNLATAVALYREAAGEGDLRAMVSLGLLHAAGEGVPRDLAAAAALYEAAAEGGSPDGMINLAVATIQGIGVPRDPARGIALMQAASEAGSAIATYNLGVLAQDGSAGAPEQAIGYFRRAIELGEPRGHVAAAVLLDEGRGIDRDPEAAAAMLLRGVASDHGEAMHQLTAEAAAWSPETLRAVQAELQRAGLYDGALDGLSGPRMAAALRDWRNGGWLRALN
jgi:tetratricopeptide (TPR) repeat protein